MERPWLWYTFGILENNYFEEDLMIEKDPFWEYPNIVVVQDTNYRIMIEHLCTATATPLTVT